MPAVPVRVIRTDEEQMIARRCAAHWLGMAEESELTMS
jgi:hypothetical protein